MAAPKIDPQIRAHLEWIGFVRPTGLVVSAPALVRAGAILNQSDVEGQKALRACAADRQFEAKEGPVPYVPDFRRFAESVLGWSFSAKNYAGVDGCPIPEELAWAAPEGGDVFRPDFAVREPEPKDGASPWQLVVKILEPGEDLDRAVGDHGRLEASPNGRMERLLRQTSVAAGSLFNGRVLRLVSAPRGENSGWIDFRIAEMVQTGGRPIATALRLLLRQQRLIQLPRGERLAALLEDSRKFQNEVSERLAEQVLHALYEFLRGFQAAQDASKGELLHDTLREHPDEVYRALLTVILRLVFLLYAEERDMLPEDETILRSYSLAGLYDRLREDAALFPDTMDQRYGAWAQLLVLFRMIHDGAESGSMRLPVRHGVLFDPDRFKFLEGRPSVGARQIHERVEAPLVPDGTIYRALEKLLVLDGERISYRALDVQHIGSIYETMMGFRLETATGRSVAIKASSKHGAPTTIDLEALVGEAAGKRDKWLLDCTGRKVTETVKKGLAAAAKVEDLHAALQPVIDLGATPDLVPKRAMILQPNEERRRSGSHYTPRELTEPIVRTTLEPILARLRGDGGRPPLPSQILELKVCDPAMGSGAFLVEACRQLGEELVGAWHAHGEVPAIPPDEDEVVFARRLIALRCLYGVDRNPLAVDLARVSLWLVTLAKDHALTFVDHALRHGDSLVGLSRQQIEAFQWTPTGAVLKGFNVREPLDRVIEFRRQIRSEAESLDEWELRHLWEDAQSELGKVRVIGDLVLAAFFEGEKAKEREGKRAEYLSAVVAGQTERYQVWLEEWRHADRPLVPFHWEIEFPEVFDRENPGFDAIVGNPPFLGGTRISTVHSKTYLDALKQATPAAGDRADLVAYFFRRGFSLLRNLGALGLLATNTISQGDTRESGLEWICENGGEIFYARKRVPWPGLAAVIVSTIHVFRGDFEGQRILEGRPVDRISAFLLPGGKNRSPQRLQSLPRVYEGFVPYGSGFLFCDRTEGAHKLGVLERMWAEEPHAKEVIFQYLGGEELNADPRQAPDRWVIYFGKRELADVERRWPRLLAMVRETVKPERETKGDRVASMPWWQFLWPRPDLWDDMKSVRRVLACSKVSKHHAFAFVDSKVMCSNRLAVFIIEDVSGFAVLQSRVHMIWARAFGATLEDRPVYTPSDCFETFPLPEDWKTEALNVAGGKYYEFRSSLMVRNSEGLTNLYNRFHDPNEQDPDVATLRELHSAMDRAVLDSYGWRDVPTDCDFFLDYEIDEEEWGDKKKPWRYRWPDDVRDAVLARLLELNAERAREDACSGAASAKKGRKRTGGKPAPESAGGRDLFS